mmetsp:Transcript_14698/g.46144  ORF Transcript_14698/g.46144 Transcript_14698/m.46144 type:complete len:205 (+) Transcript_14698:576-1190(+)
MATTLVISLPGCRKPDPAPRPDSPSELGGEAVPSSATGSHQAGRASGRPACNMAKLSPRDRRREPRRDTTRLPLSPAAAAASAAASASRSRSRAASSAPGTMTMAPLRPRRGMMGRPVGRSLLAVAAVALTTVGVVPALPRCSPRSRSRPLAKLKSVFLSNRSLCVRCAAGRDGPGEVPRRGDESDVCLGEVVRSGWGDSGGET